MIDSFLILFYTKIITLKIPKKDVNAMSKLMIGWAEESLVPNQKVNILGQFYERISDHVETPVTATAMAICKGDQKAIIVSCDLTSIKPYLLQEVRDELKVLCPDFPVECRIVGATHTHTSVGYSAPCPINNTKNILNEFLPPARQSTPLVTADETVMDGGDALHFLSKRIAKAAKNAWDNSSIRTEESTGRVCLRSFASSTKLLTNL